MLRIILLMAALLVMGNADAAEKTLKKPSGSFARDKRIITGSSSETPIIFARAKVIIRPKVTTSEDQEERELNYTAEMRQGAEIFPEGMMIDNQLKDDEAIVFSYPESKIASVNLKNLFISRDMLFVNDRGDITEIIRRVPARSSQPIKSVEPVKSIIQLAADSVKKFNIKIGDKVEIVTLQ